MQCQFMINLKYHLNTLRKVIINKIIPLKQLLTVKNYKNFGKFIGFVTD